MDVRKKILVIQTAFIGDVILTTPLIEYLIREFHEAAIDFLTTPNSANILESNPHISNLIIFDKNGRDSGFKGLIRIANILKNKHYDICITPHRSFRSAYLTWRTGAAMRIGFNRAFWKIAYTHLVRYERTLNEIERNLSLLAPIGLNKPITAPVIYSTPEDERKVSRLLDDLNKSGSKRFFAVAPGSIWPTKRWPEEYFKRFCQVFKGKESIVLLIGGPDDDNLCRRIADREKHVITLAGQLSLRETYYLLTRCTGILSNDSAPMHLGLAAHIHVFALFGPTVPEFGFAPFGPKSKIFENQELACRPCAIHGGKKCPIKTFDCMKSMLPEKIASEVLTHIHKESYAG